MSNVNLDVVSGDVASALKTMNVQERISFLKKVSEYVGAETVDSSKYLNKDIEVVGVLIHTATINKETLTKTNPVTGEITEEPVYVEQDRVVFKLADNKVMGFVSMSITSYVRDYLLPAFGMGDWMDGDKPLKVKMRITQVSSKGGRAYSIQIVG